MTLWIKANENKGGNEELKSCTFKIDEITDEEVFYKIECKDYVIDDTFSFTGTVEGSTGFEIEEGYPDTYWEPGAPDRIIMEDVAYVYGIEGMITNKVTQETIPYAAWEKQNTTDSEIFKENIRDLIVEKSHYDEDYILDRVEDKQAYYADPANHY